MAIASTDYPDPLDTVPNTAYGGAIAVLSLNGGLEVDLSDMLFADNSVSCHYEKCMTFGSHFGMAQLTVTPGLTASVASSLSSNVFSCGNVTCTGKDCQSSTDIWNTDYYSLTQAGTLDINGVGCTFIGTPLPSGSGVTVSGSCDSTEANDDYICAGGSTVVSVVPTTTPTALPTYSGNVSSSNDDNNEVCTSALPSVLYIYIQDLYQATNHCNYLQIIIWQYIFSIY